MREHVRAVLYQMGDHPSHMHVRAMAYQMVSKRVRFCIRLASACGANSVSDG